MNHIIYRIAVLGLTTALIALVGCSDNNPTPEPNPDPEPDTEEVEEDPFAMAETAFLDMNPDQMSFGGVLARLDVNGDRVLNALDQEALAQCIEDGQAPEGVLCDLVADGELDEQDAALLDFALGTVMVQTNESLTQAADALRQFVEDTSVVDIADAFHDYNEDGQVNGDDVLLFADLLEDDINQRFDLDGDGALTVRDARLLHERQADAFLGGPQASPDVNGQGGTTAVDLLMLTHAALYTAAPIPGQLDTNLDGTIDALDYCFVHDTPSDPGLYSLLMPQQDAESAFTSAPPRLELCRTDGRAIARQLPQLDDAMTLALRPSNLYLKAVDAPPAGYDLWDPARAEGLALFVVTTEPTERPLRAVSMPWDLGVAEPGDEQLQIDGEPLPDNAGLLLPDTVVPLTPSPESLLGTSGQNRDRLEPRTFSAPIRDADFAPGQKESAQQFLVQRDDLILAYERLIQGCPCSLTPEERQAYVRHLLQVSQNLEAILSVSRASLETFKVASSRLARIAQTTNQEAAAQQFLLRDDINAVAWIQVGVLVAEILLEGAKKGPIGSLGKALSALRSTYKPQFEELGLAPAFSAGEQLQDLQSSLTGGNSASELVADTITDLLGNNEELKKSVEVLTSGEFERKFIDKFVEKVVAEFAKEDPDFKLSKAALSALITELLKLIPVIYLEYQQAVALSQGALAVKATENFNRAKAAVRGQANAVREIDAIKAEIDTLRGRFLAALDEGGCPVNVEIATPCAFTLQNSIEAAKAQLVADIAASRTAFDNIVEDKRPGDVFINTCVDGQIKRSIDERALKVNAIARQLTRVAEAGGSALAREVLLERLASAMESLATKRQEEGGLARCAQLFDSQFTQADLEALATSETQRKEAFAAFEAAVRTALLDYDACKENSGVSQPGCDADLTLARQDPWAAATIVLGCVPEATMRCCGDGRRDADEECDDGNLLDGDGCSALCQIESPAEICNDNEDNDNNGLTDCEDPVCGGAPVCNGASDDLEPNDDPQSATVIPANNPRPFHAVLARYNNLALVGDDEDHFKVQVCAQGLVSVLVAPVRPDDRLTALRLELGAAPDTTDGLVNDTRDDSIVRQLRNRALEMTEVSLRLFQPDAGDEQTTDYLLQVDVHCPRDEDEDADDTQGPGIPTFAGVDETFENRAAQQGEADWREIVVCRAGRLELTLTQGADPEDFGDIDTLEMSVFTRGLENPLTTGRIRRQDEASTVTLEVFNPLSQDLSAFDVRIEAQGSAHHYMPYTLDVDITCPQPQDEVCDDEVDNDLDGDTDCDDADCGQAEICGPPPQEVCADENGQPPFGYTQVFFGGFHPALNGVVCIQDTCGNNLDPNFGIRDNSGGFSGPDLRIPYLTQPWPIPAGIPVVAEGIFSGNFFGQGDDQYDCDNAEFDGIPIEFNTPIDADGDPRLFLIDSAGGTHTFEADCPVEGGPWVRVINISPEVPQARVRFTEQAPNAVPNDLFGPVAFGEASQYIDLSGLVFEDDPRVFGTWGHYDGDAPEPFRTDFSFGASDASIANFPQASACHSIIFWQNPENGSGDGSILTVDQPPLCEPWTNRSTPNAPQNLWSSETGCTFE